MESVQFGTYTPKEETTLLIKRIYWKGKDSASERKDIMLNHNIKLQIELLNYKQGDIIELTVKQSEGRRINGDNKEFIISGVSDDKGLVVINNFMIECDFKEDNQNFSKIEFYYKNEKVGEFQENFGWTYIIENDIIKIFVNINLNIEYLAVGCIEADYKNIIQQQFQRILELSSNKSITGKIFFSSTYTTIEPPQVTIGLNISKEEVVQKKENEVVIVGGTSMNHTQTVSQIEDDGLLLMNLGETAIHELLHTLRLEHPQALTQAEDCTLLRSKLSPYHFKKNDNTDLNIYYNIMIYGFLYIDGNLLSDLWNYKRPEYLTRGQLNFIIEEIDRQRKGEGSDKPFSNYSEYWSFPPGINLTY